MNLADWNTNDNYLTVRSGKGNKDRTTYLDDGATAALMDWLIWRGEEPGALFYPMRKGGKIGVDIAKMSLGARSPKKTAVKAF